MEENEGSFYSTYGWHPRSAAAAAIAALRDLKANRRRLLDTVLLLPSLTIDKRTAARGLNILARSI
jgi:hypothetical protein